jgi:hypothetical protein
MDERGLHSAKDISLPHVELKADCPASAGLIASSGDFLFPDAL